MKQRDLRVVSEWTFPVSIKVIILYTILNTLNIYINMLPLS